MGSAGTSLMEEATEGEDHRLVESLNLGTLKVGKKF